MINTNYYINKNVLKENGLKPKELSISQDAILSLIRKYTHEAGVRNLRKALDRVFRKIVAKSFAIIFFETLFLKV
jgi:ATP-dependent Lon protease